MASVGPLEAWWSKNARMSARRRPQGAKQVQVHPLVSDARFQRKPLAELLSRIGLPDNGEPDYPAHAAERLASRQPAQDGTEVSNAPTTPNPSPSARCRGSSRGRTGSVLDLWPYLAEGVAGLRRYTHELTGWVERNGANAEALPAVLQALGLDVDSATG